MHAKNTHIQGPQIHQFNNIAENKIPRSAFKRDFTRRSTFNSGYLVPIFVDEILPGDDMHLKMTSLTRMSTPLKPIMENLYFETMWFFVPNRLVWENWEKFQGQQTNPGDSVAYTIPVLDVSKAPLNTTGFSQGSIYDYLGLPINVSGMLNISCLFNRSYDLIFNEWARDENLQNSVPIPTGDGPDDPAAYVLRRRNARKDYFTSALPWPQKGSPVTIPLAGQLPVYWDNTSTNPVLSRIAATGLLSGSTSWSANASSMLINASGVPMNIDPNGTLIADGSSINPITINLLRQAALHQQILELDARGGTRYVESIYTRFGVISPDFRLQRPELIGQGSSRINVYAIPQTSATISGDTPQGNLAAYAANVVTDHGFRYSATEHGIIIGLANVRADLTYSQGIPRMFTRSTRLDFYEPLLNGLGEQAVLKGEIFAQGGIVDFDPWGYQERFSEYRFKNSEITGLFRPTATTSLDFWHLSVEYASIPGLNVEFIEVNPPMERILAIEDEPEFLFDAHYDYTHVRPMPIRSNPGITRL